MFLRRATVQSSGEGVIERHAFRGRHPAGRKAAFGTRMPDELVRSNEAHAGVLTAGADLGKGNSTEFELSGS